MAARRRVSGRICSVNLVQFNPCIPVSTTSLALRSAFIPSRPNMAVRESFVKEPYRKTTITFHLEPLWSRIKLTSLSCRQRKAVERVILLSIPRSGQCHSYKPIVSANSSV